MSALVAMLVLVAGTLWIASWVSAHRQAAAQLRQESATRESLANDAKWSHVATQGPHWSEKPMG